MKKFICILCIFSFLLPAIGNKAVNIGDLIKTAKAGNSKAAYKLYWIFRHENYEESLEWLRMSADKGFVPAEYELGMIYNNYNFYTHSCLMLMNALKKDKNRLFINDIELKSVLGSLLEAYYFEFYNKKLLPQKLALMNEIAKDNDSYSYFLGKIYLYGLNVKPNYSKAITYFKKSNKGMYEFCKGLDLFYSADKSEKNYQKAYNIFKKNKCHEANIFVSYCLMNGYGVKKNVKKAKAILVSLKKSDFKNPFMEVVHLLYWLKKVSGC